MHQVHPVACRGKGKDDVPVEKTVFVPARCAEDESEAKGCECDGKAAEGDGTLPGDGQVHGAGSGEGTEVENTLHKAETGPDEADQKQGPAQRTDQAAAGDEASDVHAQQKIAHEAAHIVEQAEGIPRSLAP